jgi:hypothetical protein
MNQSRWRTIAVTAFAAIVASCDVGRDCTDIGCADGVFVKAEPESGVWQAGEYELTITVDGVTDHCGFSLPSELPTANVTTLLDCGAVVHANLYASGGCTDNCSLADAFQLNVTLNSSPTSVELELTRDDEVVLSDSRDVEYDDVYPNGPDCGGACKQSHYELAVEF